MKKSATAAAEVIRSQAREVLTSTNAHTSNTTTYYTGAESTVVRPHFTGKLALSPKLQIIQLHTCPNYENVLDIWSDDGSSLEWHPAVGSVSGLQLLRLHKDRYIMNESQVSCVSVWWKLYLPVVRTLPGKDRSRFKTILLRKPEDYSFLS